MVIGCCQFELHLPGCTSLKEKRRVLVSLRDRLRRRHNISFAEVAHQDLWQRAGLAVAAVGSSRPQMQRLFDILRDEIARSVPGELVAFEAELL